MKFKVNNFSPCWPVAESSMHLVGKVRHGLFYMNTLDGIKLDVSQHRLLMCMRMAKALGKEEVYLDATSHKMCWKLEKNEKVSNVFYSIDEMECYLEHLLENRWRLGVNGLGNMHPAVKRRLDVVKERDFSRTNGTPMTFCSKINRT